MSRRSRQALGPGRPAMAAESAEEQGRQLQLHHQHLDSAEAEVQAVASPALGVALARTTKKMVLFHESLLH